MPAPTKTQDEIRLMTSAKVTITHLLVHFCLVSVGRNDYDCNQLVLPAGPAAVTKS